MSKVAVIGATGSIGSQAIEVAIHLGYEVVAVSGGKRVEKLRTLAERLSADIWYSPYAGGDEKLFWDVVFEKADMLVVATSSVSDLPWVYAFLKTGRRVAIATKEMIILGWGLWDGFVWKNLYPVDSEHATVYLLLRGNIDKVRRVILTASGGAFRDVSGEEMCSASLEEVLKHPVWSMGRKITVDSATLANKAIEMLEARVLFGLAPEAIGAVIHPQVIVHAIVELVDGMSLMGSFVPDMRLPIQMAMTYPYLQPSLVKPVQWEEVGTLDFYPIDENKYRMFAIGKKILYSDSHAMYAGYLIADELAVGMLMEGRIGVCDIPVLVEDMLSLDLGEVPYDPGMRVAWYEQAKQRMLERVVRA